MRGLRARIALTAVAATGAALLAVLLLVGPGIERRIQEGTRSALLAEARLMARVVREPLARGASSQELDALVDAAGSEIHARATIIAPDGRVLADSSVSDTALAALENHRARPEVAEALAHGAGISLRHSTTVADDLLYAAVEIRQDGRLLGVSRVAAPLSSVKDEVAELRRSVAVALLVAFLLTALLSAAFSSSLAGRLGDVMEAARRFAAGELDARSKVQRSDEVGELASILNRSADQLQERLTEIARDRARTEAILGAMEEGVLAVDHRGTVLLANRALRLHLELLDPIGRHYLEAVRQREVGALVEAVLRTGERQTAEVEIHRLRRVFAVAAAPFPGAEGMPSGAVLTFHDVTERKRAEQVRRDFVANASHELRTPLTSIRGFVEALEDGAVADPDKATRFLGKIRTHADRIAALVEDLLELSRLESGERPAHWEPVAPDAVAAEVVASFSELAARKGVALKRSGIDATRVVTDADRLRRILENLVENAVKYTPAGGRVEVVSGPGPAGGALLQVVDDGPGIAAEHLPRIFERFYRVDKARSRELGGTGLGLSIVKHLAESMGASVAVESELGRGARFSVSVPGRPPSAQGVVSAPSW